MIAKSAAELIVPYVNRMPSGWRKMGMPRAAAAATTGAVFYLTMMVPSMCGCTAQMYL